MLVIDNNTKNLGILKYGIPHQFTYTVVNKFTDEVNISKVVVGCSSCTKVETDQWDIPVNGSMVIKVTFTPGSTGLQSKKITIMYSTGNIERPSIDLVFKAQVND